MIHKIIYKIIHKNGYTCCTLNKIKETKQNKNKKEKNKKESEYDVLIEKCIQSDKVKNAIYDFIKMRVAIKKPLTTKGLELLINRLQKLSASENEQIEILNNSILHNWQGIFPLNSQNNFNKNNEMQVLKNYEYKGDDTL